MEQIPLLTVTTEHRHDIVIVRAMGEIDLSTAAEIDHAVAVALDLAGASATVVLDLTGVTFFGSAGVWALVRARRECAGRGTALVVTAGPAVRRILRITHLDELLTVVASGESAPVVAATQDR